MSWGIKAPETENESNAAWRKRKKCDQHSVKILEFTVPVGYLGDH